MLTQALLSISPSWVSEHGVDDCAAAAPGEHPLCGLRKEGMLCPLKSSRSVALMGVSSCLLPKDASARNFVKGEEDGDPETHG